jgi:DnaK suppressor protein
MSKSHFLTSEQIKFLKNILEQRQDLLQKQERIDVKNLIKTVNDGIDPKHEEFSASISTESAEQQLIQRHVDEMHGVQGALKRIQQDTFGFCQDCDSPIDFPRLIAYPTALRCMRCQEALELLEKRAR